MKYYQPEKYKVERDKKTRNYEFEFIMNAKKTEIEDSDDELAQERKEQAQEAQERQQYEAPKAVMFQKRLYKEQANRDKLEQLFRVHNMSDLKELKF